MSGLDGINRSMDRSARLIKYSQLIQKVLESQDDRDAGFHAVSEDPEMYEAKGFIVSEILHIGPSYPDTVGSPTAFKDWKQCFHTHYSEASGLAILKKTYDHCYWSSLEWIRPDEKVRDVDSSVSFGFRWDPKESIKSAESFKTTLFLQIQSEHFHSSF